MWYTIQVDKLILHIVGQPGAKRMEIVGLHGEALKIRLNSPPIEGRANEALRKYLAQLFKVPLRQVSLVRGDKSRHKTVEIVGSDVDPASLLQ